MAWGMFCWIPCPYKKWDDNARTAQVAMFPLVGTMISVVVCFLWWVLDLAGVDALLSGALLTLAYFLLTGFIHLDGFMDCCDAIMPRHPDLEVRRRILKDPHTGAFAAISLALMLLVFAACFICIAAEFSLAKCCVLAVIFTTSRVASAVQVITTRSMSVSQYTAMKGGLSEAIPSLVIFVVVVVLTEVIASGPSLMTFVFDPYTNIPALAVLVVGFLAGAGGRKALGGMNGDIAGFLVTLSELAGMIAMALMI